MSKPPENFLGAVQGSNSLDGNKYGKPEAVAWELPFRRTDSEERKDGLFLYGENNDKVKQSAPTKGAQRAHNSLMLDYETSKWTLFPAFSYYHYSSLFLHFKKIR